MSEQQIEPNEANRRNSGITKIAVEGFKSFSHRQEIEIRPLTILAGANSSGKSSIMQPLLLLKQTLDDESFTGVLQLSGSQLTFDAREQLFSRSGARNVSSTFKMTFYIDGKYWLTNTYAYGEVEGDIELTETKYTDPEKKRIVKLVQNMTLRAIRAVAPVNMLDNLKAAPGSRQLHVLAEKGFFAIVLSGGHEAFSFTLHQAPGGILFTDPILKIIHVPGIRGSAQRRTGKAILNEQNIFAKDFNNYVASIIVEWQSNPDKSDNFQKLRNALISLGITNGIEAEALPDDSIALVVPLSKDRKDNVSIADVGKGVPTILPVIVALLVAQRGQLVYIEQPELHLHPKAQAAMAELLADAARRGVRVVVETHSDTLLLAIRTLVAERKLDPELVKLHWFTRDDEGVTHVASTDLDAAGAYGNWPDDFKYDFYNVESELENRYLDAAESRLLEGSAVPEHQPSLNGSVAKGHEDAATTISAPEAASK